NRGRDLLVGAAGDVGFFERQARLVDHHDAGLGPLDGFDHYYRMVARAPGEERADSGRIVRPRENRSLLKYVQAATFPRDSAPRFTGSRVISLGPVETAVYSRMSEVTEPGLEL